MTFLQRFCRHRGKLFSQRAGVHTWLCDRCGLEWPRESDTALRPERERAARAAEEAFWAEQDAKAEIRELERMNR